MGEFLKNLAMALLQRIDGMTRLILAVSFGTFAGLFVGVWLAGMLPMRGVISNDFIW